MLDYNQLRTLLAVEEAGSFEGAARALGLSSFAVSNRIKTLEKSVNAVLIERSPTRTSDAGKILCDHTRKVVAMEKKVLATRKHIKSNRFEDSSTVRIAMNEYCMNHGIGDLFAPTPDDEQALRFKITLADPNSTLKMMQSGKVQAAISTQADAIHGFKSYRLDPVEYLAVASPSFFSRCFAKSVTIEELSTAPCYRQCRNDDIAKQWVKSHVGERCKLTLFKYPFNDGALNICLNDNAWALLPAQIVKSHIDQGLLVELKPHTPINRHHYWHVSGTMVKPLEAITKKIKYAAYML